MLRDVLQHYGQSGQTGKFIVNCGDQPGEIYLVSGIVAHAEIGVLTGDAAMCEMLGFNGSEHEWVDAVTPRRMTMSSQVQDVLLRVIQMQGNGEFQRIKSEAEKLHAVKSVPESDAAYIIRLNISSAEIEPFGYTIRQKQVRVGRNADNDLPLNDSSVSRRHAMLIQNYEALLVRDLGSMNGLKVDGQPVTQGLVRDGQTLLIGEVEIQVSVTKVDPIIED
ncbi:MAG: FHA domain-containing protein [Verrucomicrobiales bacterium]|jgi:hypothetical protein|nr:FHA domain-containing protein [Verrucomicrobiales bacterium]